MSDSAREEHTTAFEPGSYAIHQSVIEGPENYTDLDQPRQRPYQAATDDWAVQVSPPNVVSRRIARWPGMAVEIVQATRRGRIDYHFCAPMHTPQRYQLSRRIERAKALLAKHAASVTEVGLTVGYNDASAF
jgi:hypothetical protein